MSLIETIQNQMLPSLYYIAIIHSQTPGVVSYSLFSIYYLFLISFLFSFSSPPLSRWVFVSLFLSLSLSVCLSLSLSVSVSLSVFLSASVCLSIFFCEGRPENPGYNYVKTIKTKINFKKPVNMLKQSNKPKILHEVTRTK